MKSSLSAAPPTRPSDAVPVVYFDEGGRWRAPAGEAVITLESKMAALWKRINRSISQSAAVQHQARVRLPVVSAFPCAINARGEDGNN